LIVVAQIKAIHTHCPTRFATMHLVLKSIVASKDALKSAVISEEWDDASNGSEKASAFYSAVVGRGAEFWKDAEFALQLVQPISDTIHQIEGDRPLLSSLLPIYRTLLQHARNFTERHAGTKYVQHNIVGIFKDRIAKHHHPAITAAYILDPASWEQEKSGAWSAPVASLEEDEVDAARDLIERICGSMESVDSEWSKLQLSTIPSKMAKSLDYLCRRVEKGNGKVEISTVDERMNFWQRFGKCEFPALSVAAVRLLSCHTTTCATERNWSVWGSLYKKSRSRLAVERATKLIYICANLTEHKSKSEEEIMLAVLEDGRTNADKESEDDVEIVT
jgi:hypothetical protein